MRIKSVWESPTNEDTKYFTVGANYYSKEWTTGEIKYSTDQEQSRVLVYDTEGNLRVDLPYGSCVVEYATED